MKNLGSIPSEITEEISERDYEEILDKSFLRNP